MRILFPRLLVLCVTLVVQGWVDTARAQGLPEVKPQWEIIAECQMIVLPQKSALPLIPSLSDDTKIDAAVATLEQMIGRGEATLFANLFIRGLSANRATAESVEELRYPTEFDPPNLPGNVPQEKALEALKAWPVVGITPTAFETRKIGATLELEAVVSDDGKWVAAFVVAKHVRFLRFAKYDAGLLPSGERLSVEQPQFSSLENNMSLQMRAGQRVLVGLHKVPGEENVMELFILRIRTQKSGVAP